MAEAPFVTQNLTEKRAQHSDAGAAGKSASYQPSKPPAPQQPPPDHSTGQTPASQPLQSAPPTETQSQGVPFERPGRYRPMTYLLSKIITFENILLIVWRYILALSYSVISDSKIMKKF